MDYLNSNTKKAKDFIRRYNRATDNTLYDVYKKPSSAKIYAYNNVVRRDFERECESKDNPRKDIIDFHGYKIIGANCTYFTLARLMAVIDKKTGAIDNIWLVVDTPTRQYHIMLGVEYIK